jgi:RHS repeat-associated protein
VYGPRQDVPTPTVYRLDPYGGALTVERPLAPSRTAVTVTKWDLAHQTKEWETDARGRKVSFGYDASGNLTSRRITLGRLPASGDERQGTDDVMDAAGSAIGESVELWTYEPSFNQVVCHADANGYVTWNSIDSSTGKVLKSTRYANRSSSQTCALPIGPVGSEVRYEYCGVNGACRPGAVKGDLVRTVDATGATEILALDGYGNPLRSQRGTSASGWATTTFTYDDRSRLVSELDTLGHATTWTPNELDQIEMVARGNTKGASPGLTETRHYYPGGQVRDFANGLGLSRQFTLDAANRTIKTVETGPGLTGALESRAVFDEASNTVSVTDRRGATLETAYDWGNRPRTHTARVLAGDLARYSAQRGEPSGPITIATLGYDDVGNKVFETDVHGHRTDYVLDALYRATRVLSPPVPGATVGDPSQVSYTTTRRHDLNGNRIYEEDGNHHATSWSYDYANRLALTVDAAGRYESRGYDGNGNLVAQENGATGPMLALVATLKRVWDPYDGLNRPTALNEMVPSGTSELLYGSRWVYDDSAHGVYQRDRRGYVTTARLDDLDRVFEQVVDDQPGALARAPDDAVAGATAVAAKTSFEYDGAGNRKATVDALGRRTGETFDALNRVVARNLPMGVGESFAHDGEGHLIQHTDRRGVQSRSTLDLLARVTKEELAETITNGGAWLAARSVAYDDANAKVTETDALNRSVTRFLDGMHRETRREEPLSRVVETRYDAAVKRGYRDEGLYYTTWAYDAANRPTQVVEVDGATGQAKYMQRFESHDDQLEELAYDRNGTLTTRTYDGLHRVLKSVRGDVDAIASEETAYDGAGNPTRTTSYGAPSTRQRLTERHFDGANRKVSETFGVGTPDQATTAYAYDAVGNRIRMKGPRTTAAFDLRETYDDLNRAVRSEDALGNVTARAYDAVGNKLCEVRPLGMPALQDGAAGVLDVNGIIGQVCPSGSRYTTRWQYDELNKLIGSTDALGGSYAFVYDRVRNLVAKLNPNQGLLTYEYDALNRRTHERQHFDRHASVSRDSVPGEESPVDPVAGSGTASWHTEYDADGNLWRLTDPKNQVTASTYEVGNRLKRQEFSSPVARELPALNSIDFAHDGNGNLTGADEAKSTSAGPVTSSTVRVFDALDRLKSETRDGRTVQYTYDEVGNRASVTDPAEVATSYTYDAHNRLSTATTPQGIAQYSYWPDSLLKGLAYPNGLSERRCYDDGNRLTDLVAAKGAISEDCATAVGVASRYGYSYDADGNRNRQLESRTDPATGGLRPVETSDYGYDALDRLQVVRYADGKVVAYDLDAVGNRRGERETTPGARQASEALPDYAGLATAQLAHDVRGAFNAADWLLSRTDSVDASRTVAFGYDFDGNQISRTTGRGNRTLAWDARNTLTAVYENGVEVGRYDYDRNLIRVRRTTQTENVEYVLDDKHVLNELDGSQAGKPSIRRYHYGTKVLAVTESAGTRYIVNDGIGSASDFWSSTGTLAQSRQYHAWGGFRNGTAPAAGEAKVGFTGHFFDPETGNNYMLGRYQDPVLGIFVSRDPFLYMPTEVPNLYLYARGNPLRFFDPTGLVDEIIGPHGDLDFEICDAACEAAKARAVDEVAPSNEPTYVPGEDEASQRAAQQRAAAKAGAKKRARDQDEARARRLNQAREMLAEEAEDGPGAETEPEKKGLFTQAGEVWDEAHEKLRKGVQKKWQASFPCEPGSLGCKFIEVTGDVVGRGAEEGADWLMFGAVGKVGRLKKAAKAGAASKLGHAADLAIGLSKHPSHARKGLLGRFAAQVKAKTYWDYHENTSDMRVLGERMLGLMDETKRIHINLDGMLDEGRTVQDILKMGKEGIGQGNVTNWEIFQAVAKYKDKITFYVGGAPKTAAELGL